MTELLDEIWVGDLLERKEEAQLFINYIESVSQRLNVREDVSSFTISVDAGYGEGKTYFLKRVAKQMKINHPVAFIDAWRDDLADEPLTALVVTLQDALGDLIESDSTIKSKFQNVREKAGAVAKIAGKGLLKKALSLAITEGAVKAAEEVIGDVTEDTKKEVSKTVEDISDEITSANALNTPSSYMQERIDDFKAGRNAIEELKASLRALVDSLDAHEMHAPIVIFIDELDRCRPTYAVKLLEEIKHLFDVEGLVFVFGIHTGQLAHSVAGAYGANFDGKAYLSRFINRQYRLKTPKTMNFVRYLMGKYNIQSESLYFPELARDYNNRYRTVSDKIAFYLRCYKISIRDTIKVMEAIHSCHLIMQRQEVLMPLLLPLILSKINGAAKGELIAPLNGEEKLKYVLYNNLFEKPLEIDYLELTDKLKIYSNYNNNQISTLINKEGDAVAGLIADYRINQDGDINPIIGETDYVKLIETVDRYSDPANPQS